MSDRASAQWALDTLHALYDAEINCRLSSFWDAGWSFSLGDDINGFQDQGGGGSLEEAVEALAVAACQRYPGLMLPEKPSKGANS